MPTFASVPRITSSSLRSLQSRFAQLKSSAFVRSAGILSSGTAIGHAFTLGAAPILTRVYGPRDFGALGLFTSFLGIVGVAVSLQYDVSIVAGRDDAEAAYLTFGALLFVGPVSALSGALLWMLIHFSALGFGGMPWCSPLLLAFTMAFVGLFMALRYWSLREQEFGQIAQGTVVQSGGRATLQAVLGVAGFHSSGMLLGETLGRGMGMSKMLRSAWPRLRVHLRRFSRKEFLRVLWLNRKFPMYSLPSSFLNALCLSLSLPLLIREYGVSTGGYYSLVWKAITVPSVLVITAVGDTFHSQLATCARDTPDEVTKLFRVTSLWLLALGIGPTLVLWFWGPPLFGWAFGAQWRLSGTMAAIVAPWYLAQFIVSPLTKVVFVLSGQEMKLVWDVSCLIALLAVFFVAHWRGLAPLKTITILSMVYTLLTVAYYVVLLRIIARFNSLHCRMAPAA